MKIKIKELEKLALTAIKKYGYSEQESATILKVLMYAQLRGNNQGLIKLIGPGIPKTAEGKIEIEKETGVSALVNAHKNHAMLAVNRGVDIAIEKAKAHGISIVGIHHINTSSGAIGYYVKRIAEAGFVGFIFAGSPPVVATQGSYEALLGTNPLAIGMPGKNKPLVFDMATAAMAKFGVIEAATAGRKLPKDISYDKEGNLSDDPKKVLDGGSVRTFDKGYKGAGLSLMIQALTGPLIRASYFGIGDVPNNLSGHLLLAFDPDILGGKEELITGISHMSERLKSTKKLVGIDEIYLPSERGDRITEKSLKTGETTIEDNLFKELKKLIEFHE